MALATTSTIGPFAVRVAHRHQDAGIAPGSGAFQRYTVSLGPLLLLLYTPPFSRAPRGLSTRLFLSLTPKPPIVRVYRQAPRAAFGTYGTELNQELRDPAVKQSFPQSAAHHSKVPWCYTQGPHS